MTQIYEELKSAIVKALPEIMELSFGCDVRSGKGIYTVVDKNGSDCCYVARDGFLVADDVFIRDEILGHTITIVHILRAISKKKCPYPIIGILDDGEFVENGNTGGVYSGTGVYFDLTKSLEDQSDDCLVFLHKILCQS